MKHSLCKLIAFLGYIVLRTNGFISSSGINVKPVCATLNARLQALRSASLNQDEIPLISSLAEVTPPIKERYFFPGHNGGEFSPKSVRKVYGSELFSMDLPELDGLDNIHSPEGPLLRALLLAADLFGSFRSWFLVNGSTSGILSAILATVQLHHLRQLSERGDTVTDHSKRSIMILGRDSHKASFDGLRLADCDGALLPCINDQEFGVPLGVEFDSISDALEKYGSQVCGVLLTRPSYQGVMCSSARLKEIVQLCHSKSVPVIVDEAHGSHLRFLGRPDMLDALACGADIVVQSSHKTLTALSQAAMMHLGSNAFSFSFTENTIDGSTNKDNSVREEASAAVEEEEGECRTEAAGMVLHDCFSMLTTTSPNMALLVSLDATRAQMAREGIEMIQTAAASADEIRYELRLQNALRIEKTEEGQGVGGVELLDDSASIRPSKRQQKKNMESVPKIPGVDFPQWFVDPLRLTVRFPERLALDVDDIMCEERGIYCELNLESCISYAIPPGSTSKSLKVLRKALLAEGEAEVEEFSSVDQRRQSDVVLGDVTYLHTDAAKKRNSVPVSLVTVSDRIAAIGRISAETICPYPPGIPVVIRGERLTAGHLEALTALQFGLKMDQKGRESGLGSGCTVTGCSDRTLQTVRVILE